MILYGSALSDPDRHNHENLPIMLAGRGSGTIKTGRHIKYNSAFRTKKEVPLSNLLLVHARPHGGQRGQIRRQQRTRS